MYNYKNYLAFWLQQMPLYFLKYVSDESLNSTRETNIILYVNELEVSKNLKKKKNVIFKSETSDFYKYFHLYFNKYQIFTC